MRLLLVISSYIFMFRSIAQSNDCDSIPWSASRLLVWQDFKDVPDSITWVGAVSYISFKYRLVQEKDKINLIALIYFQPCKSWVKTPGSFHSLQHEQTHFNIDELSRRTFLKDVLSQHYFPANILRNIEHTYFVSMASRNLMHAIYDQETDFHRNENKQRLWDDMIIDVIDQLKEYSGNRYEVKMSK